MGFGKSREIQKCGIVYGIIYAVLFLIMSFILIGISVRYCDKVTSHSCSFLKENYCLSFNGNEQTIYNGKLYDGGRYWLGAGYSFIQFPRMQMAYVWSS